MQTKEQLQKSRALSRVLGRKKEPPKTTVKLDANVFPWASRLAMVLCHNLLNQSPFPRPTQIVIQRQKRLFLEHIYCFIPKPNPCGTLCNFPCDSQIWKAMQLNTTFSLPSDRI